MTISKTTAVAKALEWIQHEWKDDGAAVAATAEAGEISEADMADMRDCFGADADTVAAELLAICQAKAS